MSTIPVSSTITYQCMCTHLYLETTGGYKQDASEQQTSLKSPGNEHHQEVTYQCVCTHLEPTLSVNDQQTLPKSQDSKSKSITVLTYYE